MMIFGRVLPRRTFLRGLGTTVALPLLDAMVPAFAATRNTAVKPAMRVGYVYVPSGRIMDKWTPKHEGAGFAFSPTLAPLEPFRNQLLVFSGLNIEAADQQPGESGGSHARSCAAFLTGVHPSPGKGLGISVDQVVAKQLGQSTQFASLELGLDPSELGAPADGAYAGYFSSTISWRSATTPLPTEDNPRRLFERLFGDSASANPTGQQRRIEKQRSILDSVTQRVGWLSRKIGPADRVKLNEYLDAIRDTERRVQNAATRTSTFEELPEVTRPEGVPDNYSDHAKLMFDLLVLAWQSDLTRVTSFMMGHEGTNRMFRDVGKSDGHHALTHHKGNVESIAAVEKIDRLQAELFTYLLEKLRSTPDGDGSLLDHSMILYGSALSDGNLHLHRDVPIVLVGGANGKIKGGRHLRFQGPPLSNLHLAMLDLAGVEEQPFISEESDATGKLEGLTA
jgi:hypothetical protein